MFIKFPTTGSQGFKDRYLELTGEKIQASPIINDVETHCLVGSSRITQEHADILSSEFSNITIGENIPAGWVNKNNAPQ